MSTAILANNLMKIGKEKGLELEVEACGFEVIDHYLSNDSDFVMVLVAPQIKHKFGEVSGIVDKYGIVSNQINFDEYAPIALCAFLLHGTALADPVAGQPREA